MPILGGRNDHSVRCESLDGSCSKLQCEAPKLMKTWVKKEGTITEYFQDFVSHIAQAFIHKQLDKLTAAIHRRNVLGIEADSKRFLLHCDFSQDLSHAMADQSMCEYFDIISSSLFIAVAHFFIL